MTAQPLQRSAGEVIRLHSVSSPEPFCDALEGEPAVLSPDDIARITDTHVNTVRTLLNQGILPGVRMGRQWRTTRVQLARYLAGE